MPVPGWQNALIHCFAACRSEAMPGSAFMSSAADVPLQVPPQVKQVLLDFVQAAERAFGADLPSIVLYGSAAEGRLRATSDVNLLVVLSAFDPAQADALGEPLRLREACQAGEMRNSTTSQRSAASFRASCQRSPGARPRSGFTSRKYSLQPFSSSHAAIARAAALFALE